MLMAKARMPMAKARMLMMKARMHMAKARMHMAKARMHMAKARMPMAKARMPMMKARMLMMKARMLMAKARMPMMKARKALMKARKTLMKAIKLCAANSLSSPSPNCCTSFYIQTLKQTKIILTIAIGLTLFSCEKVKRKGSEVVDKTKQQIKDKEDDVVDKVIPTFDSEKPDTKFNKKRFKESFGFAPTQDISKIYCFDDQIGIDSKFLFSFKCDTSTRDRIIKHLNLVQAKEPNNYSRGLWESFPWWDSLKIVTLKPFWNKSDHEIYRYLWYDKDRKMAYYIDFDL